MWHLCLGCDFDLYWTDIQILPDKFTDKTGSMGKYLLNFYAWSKAAFTKSPYLRICVKKYGYAYKNTLMRIKFLLSLVYFMLPFTEHAYLRMRRSACVFLRLAKNKIRTRYAYFSGFYKEIFLRCDVTRLLSVVVLVFETLNLSSVLTKIKTFIFAQT